MEIILYSSIADPRDLYKGSKLTTIDTVEAEPFYPLEVTVPEFRLAYNQNFRNINYCYVAELGRYYFISDITLESGNAMIIHCECDVLMSFRDDILGLDAICLRNEYDFNKYIQDPNIPSSTKATITNYIINESTPFIIPNDDTTNCYVLTLNGLVGEVPNE